MHQEVTIGILILIKQRVSRKPAQRAAILTLQRAFPKDPSKNAQLRQ